MLQEAGCKIVYSRSADFITRHAANGCALVVHWKSQKEQPLIKAAKQAGVPVLVITARLADALKAEEPFGDLYLETPADDKEVSALLIEMITGRPIDTTPQRTPRARAA
jgi:hypothetical protein